MAQPPPEKKPNCYIAFRVTDDQRFDIFLRFFNALKPATQRRQRESVESAAQESTYVARRFSKAEDWLLTFLPQSLEYMGMPTHRDAIIALRRWHEMDRKTRRKDIGADESLRKLAEFADMVARFEALDYELIGCEKESDTARVLILSHGFNSKEAVEEMLLFFGFFSIIENSC